ncbi:nucleotidyltransferase family protein [Cobetia sp. QF-1]|uniref:nucleotidyltransferase family protein n=1 Tax=Cobetia sp. QF-1 TaxID=1969833 RepID=UPI000B53C2BA|nr:nucleotidyltransferase family protein [Cobetia sp. QF-1]
MRAMILAAGFGTRMRPLTDHTPKPLLEVAGLPLLEHHLLRLEAAGVDKVVINVGHLAERILNHFGATSGPQGLLQASWQGHQHTLTLAFSREEVPLETGGGIARALSLPNALTVDDADDTPFLLINGDVWCDADLPQLMSEAIASRQLNPLPLAGIVLVDNPPHHPKGDFLLTPSGMVRDEARDQEGNRLTFSGLSWLSPTLIRHAIADNDEWCDTNAVFKLAPLLRDAMHRGEVRGYHHRGKWIDVGTPERLAELDTLLNSGM